MRVLILGGTGMLGHQLWAVARRQCSVLASVRRESVEVAAHAGFPAGEMVVVDDICESEQLRDSVHRSAPDVVVNCIGVVKQRIGQSTTEDAIAINALLPHQLSRICSDVGARLIQVSTDCVFSGRKGGYLESDPPDPVDAYGMTKALGEVRGSRCLVVRTSMIGPELAHHTGLLDWVLSQRGRKVTGFRHARFSGLSTPELSRVIVRIVREHQDVEGLVHVAGPAIDKCALLTLIDAEYRLGLEIVPADEPVCDRSLRTDRFAGLTNHEPPDWPTMIRELRSLEGASKGEAHEH